MFFEYYSSSYVPINSKKKFFALYLLNPEIGTYCLLLHAWSASSFLFVSDLPLHCFLLSSISRLNFCFRLLSDCSWGGVCDGLSLPRGHRSICFSFAMFTAYMHLYCSNDKGSLRILYVKVLFLILRRVNWDDIDDFYETCLNVMRYLWVSRWLRRVFSWTRRETILWTWKWNIFSGIDRGYWEIVSRDSLKNWQQSDNPSSYYLWS